MAEEKIVVVERKDAERFAFLDPFERLTLLELPETFALAAMSDEEGEGLSPVGLLIAQIYDKDICIDWIGVTSSLQGRGIGERLLLAAFRIANGSGLDHLTAVISSEYVEQNLGECSTTFFSDRLFYKEENIPSEYSGSIADLKKLQYVNRDPKRLPKAVSLDSFPAARLGEILKQLDGIKGAAKLCPVKGLKTRLNLKSSFVLLDVDEPCGALLVQEVGDMLVPVYMYAESENEEATMIIHALMSAEQDYGSEKDVKVYIRSDKLKGLMNRVLPDSGCDTGLLTADLEDYKEVYEAVPIDRLKAQVEG